MQPMWVHSIDRISHLKIHIKRHGKEKSHKCEQCDHRFHHPCDLKRHLKVHNRELNVYTCDECGFSFRHSGSLKTHPQMHSKWKWPFPHSRFGHFHSSAQNENLRPPLNTNIPLISGKYGFRNHFWPLESRFLMRKSEKNAFPFSQNPLMDRFWSLGIEFYKHFCERK